MCNAVTKLVTLKKPLSRSGNAMVTGRSRFGHATVTVTVQKRTEYCIFNVFFGLYQMLAFYGDNASGGYDNGCAAIPKIRES